MYDMLFSFGKTSRDRLTVYAANFLVSFHYFLVIYITSSLLSEYVSTQILSLLYVVGSILSVLLFAWFTHLVKYAGNYRLTLFFTALEIFALLGLGFGESTSIVIASFIIFLAVSPTIYLGLDVFLESLTKNERTTGGVRGTFLSMQNITMVASPLVVGLLLYDSEYWRIYLTSTVFLLIASIVIAIRLRRFHDAPYHPKPLWKTVTYVLNRSPLRRVFAAQLILRLFYAWMVIYTPLYLFEYVGFSWAEIGTMFSIMLLPFLLLEFPLGKLADSKLGEKEIMIFGFIIMTLATASIPFLPHSFLWWASILFISRIGAACVEISTESYFFKHVDGELADAVSLFRMARPLTYVVAAGIAAFALSFISLQWSFLVLALVTVWGLRYAFALKDTK